MQRNYRCLRQEDREVIYRMSQADKSQVEIAEAIGFGQSTVSKELSRNRGLKGCRPKQAQRLADGRRKAKGARSSALEGDLIVEAEKRLAIRHSPEQIAGALSKEGVGKVSHEAIHKHIREDKKAGGALYTHLRINGRRRYRRRAKAGRYNKIPDRVGIEERPASVDNRTRCGDWEIDPVEGSKGTGYVLSLCERKTKVCRLRKLETKGAEETAAAIIGALAPLRARTLTYDNGAEFARHPPSQRRSMPGATSAMPTTPGRGGGGEPQRPPAPIPPEGQQLRRPHRGATPRDRR